MKYIQFALSFVLLFTACTPDNDPVPTPPSNDAGLQIILENVPLVPNGTNFTPTLNVDFGTDLVKASRKIELKLPDAESRVSPAINTIKIEELIKGVTFKVTAADKTTVKEYTLKVTINVVVNLQVKTYYGNLDTLGFAILGPLFTGKDIVTITGNFHNGDSIQYKFGTKAGAKLVANDKITFAPTDLLNAGTIGDGTKLSLEATGTTKQVVTFMPRLIRNWKDLYSFSFHPSIATASAAIGIELRDNIKFPAPGTDGFPTIGHIPFNIKGKFDGHNFKVEDLYVNRTDTFGGIFREIQTGTEIKNLQIVNPVVKSHSAVGSLGGAIPGRPEDVITVSVQNVHVTGANINGYWATGGLIGEIHGGVISGCSVKGSIQGVNEAGGLIGFSYSETTQLLNCTTDIQIKVDNYAAGGLIGTMYYGKIDGCKTAGTVKGSTNVGGIIGKAWYTITITNSSTTCTF